MVVRVRTQKDFQRRRNPGFCYLCGKPFVHGDQLDDEHIVSTSSFAIGDRTPPAILRAHRDCNSRKSPDDERVGQMLKLLRGELPADPNKQRLQKAIVVDRDGREEPAGILEFGLERSVIGWLRGFHSVLYAEYLPLEGGSLAFTPPWPVLVGIPPRPEPLHPAHRQWVALIRRNRLTETVDSITAYEGKLRYECVWDYADDGRAVCIFALDLDGWTSLSSETGHPRRSCSGQYVVRTAIPELAARATSDPIICVARYPDDAFSE